MIPFGELLYHQVPHLFHYLIFIKWDEEEEAEERFGWEQVVKLWKMIIIFQQTKSCSL